MTMAFFGQIQRLLCYTNKIQGDREALNQIHTKKKPLEIKIRSFPGQKSTEKKVEKFVFDLIGLNPFFQLNEQPYFSTVFQNGTKMNQKHKVKKICEMSQANAEQMAKKME